MKTFKRVVIGVVVAFVCLLVYGYAVGPKKDIRAAIDSVPVILGAQLKDPASLQIDAMTVYRAYDGVLHVCGQYRAKNSFGAYVRDYFVIAPGFPTPLYIADTNLSEAFDACSGEVVFVKH